MIDAPRIDATEVRDRLLAGERIVFIDTRSPHAFAESDVTLSGAIRVPADLIDAYVDEIPTGRTVVAFCT